MLDYIKNLLTLIFESRQNLDRELLMLAKTEFKDDWEYHYQKLLEHTYGAKKNV